jgi:hypothetical protein
MIRLFQRPSYDKIRINGNLRKQAGRSAEKRAKKEIKRLNKKKLNWQLSGGQSADPLSFVKIKKTGQRTIGIVLSFSNLRPSAF